MTILIPVFNLQCRVPHPHPYQQHGSNILVGVLVLCIIKALTTFIQVNVGKCVDGFHE